MKRIIEFCLSAAFFTTAFLLTGCSDEFLKDKQDYTNTTGVIYNNYEGAKERIDNLYALLLPRSNSDVSYDNPSTGKSDDNSASTEEYGGLSIYVSDNVLTNTNIPDLFYNEVKTSRSPYGRIRNCNDAIEGIKGGTLPEDQKKELLGQAYFFRAWVYYRLVKTYGGVPIVDKVLNPVIGDEGGLDLAIPRATTKECIEFICNDLKVASEYLPVVWDNTNYGRVTAGAALALQGRVRLLYASPLFNRADDLVRWDSAYVANKRAIEKLQESNYFGLAYLSAPGVNASGWAKMFSDYQSPEAVFVTLYNNVKESGSSSVNFNNTWENAIRPVNTAGGGGISTTAQMVDLFPLANGKPAVGKTWTPINGYDKDLFFLNRDPRFYRTFAFPGVQWKFSGDPTTKGTAYPYTGANYSLWNYVWYSDAAKQSDEQQSGFAADGLGSSYKGIYIRKRTDDLGVNPNPLYNYDLTNERPFVWSAAPYMEIRYAEVLLNFAEAACGAGHGAEALAALRQIRQRVGYTGDCGLDESLASNRAGLFAAILYERQIELAYEGKRFDDMRRWMLWDGGVGQSTLKASWALTGFNGNTCSYLGVDPLNGKRRTGIEIRVSESVAGGGIAEAKQDKDPIVTNAITRPAAWDLSQSLSSQGTGLEMFYRYNLKRKQKLVDTKDKVISFRPEYYFIGLKASAQSNNVTLLQTIGWTDSQRGSTGTFDPLAE